MLKLFKCKYCNGVLKSPQALSRHQNNRPKKCLLLDEVDEVIAPEVVDEIIAPEVVLDVVDVNPEVAEVKIIKSEDKLSSKEARLQALRLEIERIEQESFTPEQIKIIDLEKENKVLKDEIERLKTSSSQQHKYKAFYYKYMLEDAETLVYFDVKNEFLIKELEDRLTLKLNEEMIRLEHTGLASVLYEFLIPKYFRVVKICDRYIVKTKNKEGVIVEDFDMKIMKGCIKSTVLRYLDCYNDDVPKDSKLMDSLEMLINDINHNYINQLFNLQICRLIDLSDGKEVRKNVEKMTYLLKK